MIVYLESNNNLLRIEIHMLLIII